MKLQSPLIRMFALAGAVTAASLFSGCATGVRATSGKPATVERVAYHGWKDALRIRSGTAEVVVVPEIGRVMSFRLLDGDNVFWEDRALDGKRGDASGREWINFGGDKTWPSPEADWGKYTGRKQWMPPAAFDSLPVSARIENHDVVLTSPVDPHYGIRTIRRVQLDGSRLRIATTYERVSGSPSKIGIWVITQFKDPMTIHAPVATSSKFPDGYSILSGKPWTLVRRKKKSGADYVEITRDPKASHKMACTAGQLTWIGKKEICVVTSPRVFGGKYPDGGASAEVYANPNPKKYVELEMLGPLSVMKPGDRISRANTYVLIKKSDKDATAKSASQRR